MRVHNMFEAEPSSDVCSYMFEAVPSSNACLYMFEAEPSYNACSLMFEAEPSSNACVFYIMLVWLCLSNAVTEAKLLC